MLGVGCGHGARTNPQAIRPDTFPLPLPSFDQTAAIKRRPRTYKSGMTGPERLRGDSWEPRVGTSREHEPGSGIARC